MDAKQTIEKRQDLELTLEAKINAQDQNVGLAFFDMMFAPKVCPTPQKTGEFYKKQDYADALTAKLKRDGMAFSENELDEFKQSVHKTTIPKEILKQVSYGTIQATVDYISPEPTGELKWVDDNTAEAITKKVAPSGILPRQVINLMTPWEAVYAYAGIWSIKNRRAARQESMKKDESNPEGVDRIVGANRIEEVKIDNQTLYQNIRMIVLEGMDRLKRVSKKCNKVNEIENLPYEKAIRARYAEPIIKSSRELYDNLRKSRLVAQADPTTF